MTDEPIRRRGMLLLTATLLVALHGCSTPPTQDADILDARLAGPCEQLNIAWSNAATTLHVVRCDAHRRRDTSLLYAYTAEPIKPNEVPLVVTGIADDAWSKMTALWADAATTTVLSQMGYNVETAQIRLEINDAGTPLTVHAEIQLGAQSMLITGQGSAAARDITQQRALVTDDAASVTAFFGPESASRFLLEDFVIGQMTLLKDIQALQEIREATLDRNHRSERIFWRLPK